MGKDNEDLSNYVESASSSSMISLSQDVSASIVSNEVDHEEKVSHIVPVATTLFVRMLPLSIKKQILKSHLFLCVLK